MKRLFSLILALALLACSAAFSEEWVTIDHKANRKIELADVGINTVPDGVSPVTGLPLLDYDVPEGYGGQAATGRYMPMLMQVDNAEGGLGKVAPWGLDCADIVYELPLYSNGPTRITFLFSDIMPPQAGPVRSARIGHAWLRQEWNGGFIHVGTQTMEGSDAGRELGRTGGFMGRTRFDGNASQDKPWMKFLKWDKTFGTNHNVNVNVGEICNLVPDDIIPVEHAYLFTDETPAGDAACEVAVNWNHDTFKSILRYNEEIGQYQRYLYNEKGGLEPYVDRLSGYHAGFDNVIIQFTDTRYNGGDGAAPITQLVGEGNADFFMGGVHLSGYWKRASGDSRTVYYNADGTEIEMLRGTKYIVCLPPKCSVQYRATY